MANQFSFCCQKIKRETLCEKVAIKEIGRIYGSLDRRSQKVTGDFNYGQWINID
ncbi:MAG: hypothetical protein HPY46_06075 [Candidatus Aminicenantes bacterium]|nr:hypothetical protein [Candidatus Aminicenantes bacterium]